jgi:prepilin-type N-terminal cleavage/methylation domain-containing protein
MEGTGKRGGKMKMLTSPIGLSARNSLPGFTLLELLMVLLIVGFFTTLLTLRIEGVLAGGDLRLASRVIIGEINRLRGKAAHTRQDLELSLDLDEERFYPVEPLRDVEKESGERISSARETGEKLNAFRVPQGVELEDVVVFSRGKIQEGEARIRFYANGCVQKSLLHLKNTRNERYTLEINPLTGRVTIYDRYVEQKEED